MNWFLLYLVLLKATASSFSGLASLPIIRDELVVHRQLITDDQLNMSVVIARSTPGPVGLYVVSVGYFAAGIPGAVAGWLALSTPAFLIIPLVHYFSRNAEHPRIKAVLQAVVLASSGLLLSATAALARTTINDWVTATLAAGTVLVLLLSKVETFWVMAGAAAISLGASLLLGQPH